jgi:hypothetical protein
VRSPIGETFGTAGICGFRPTWQAAGCGWNSTVHNTVTDVWVDGHHLGQHSDGYAHFRFDASAAVNLGRDNGIAVRIDNTADPGVAPLSGDFTMDGGLYRSVRLVATDPLHIDMHDHGGPGLYLQTPAVAETNATVAATTELANDSGDGSGHGADHHPRRGGGR